ncbi:hypothetical protein Tsubulata_035230 [Turnera subulata]|uniref:Protein transport protein Sec24-like n=1 Tax=Turnera subulata TaxID=218843 RepID=A0A9Q0FUM0_9ROSI|nr:hypothetical protein Tsubulata_035230 [Turnera subulata]
MGTENPGRPNFPFASPPTPFSAAPPSMGPFSTSGPVVGSDASGFRPAPPSNVPPPSNLPFRPPAVGSEPPSGFRPAPPTRFNDPSVAMPPSFPLPSGGPFQSPVPPPTQFSSAPPPQALPVQPPTMGQPPFQHPPASVPPSFRPPPPSQAPSVSFGPPPGRPGFQPPLPGYIKQSNEVPPPPAAAQQSPFPAQPGGYTPAVSGPPSFVPPQGGFVSPSPVQPPFGLHKRDPNLQPGSLPPMGGVQGLAEDFSSLSLGQVPGTLDVGLDPKTLPRPLDGDVEPNLLAEGYSPNCDPRYLRLTTRAIPNSQSLASRWHLPLGAVVCPLAEAPDGEEVPVLNFVSGIIRCRRCRTYVNPFVTFTDAGRKWRCNICSLLNDVPGEYFCQLDATGRRMDLDQRPELTQGSVEFVAPTEYMVRPPMPPLYFFLIDVSISAARSGMLEVVAQTIKSCLDDLPGFPRTQIGFITFDSTIHFYNMKSSLTQPQMMVVSDLDDVFVPLPDDLLVNLADSRSVVDVFLDTLPSMFQDNVNVESAFGPALKAAFSVMNQLGGKMLIFQNTMPSLGVGRLKLRGDDVRVYGTDKEHALRLPEDPFYKQMAADLTKYQIGVNLYAFSDKYTDIASLGALAKYTGGQVYQYPGFQSVNHGEKLRHELARDLTRETAWEAVMRIRCGKGIRFSSYHGNFMLRSTDLLALPAVDCDKAYAMQTLFLGYKGIYYLKISSTVKRYTASCGERRIRVHTAAAPVVSDLGEMYRQADTGAIVSLFSRLAIEKTLSHKLEDGRNSVQLRIVKAFREYRNLYSVQHRLGNRMIYPESLKFLPLYGLALCKSTPLRGGFADVQLDERCAAGFTIMALPVKKLLKLLYPSLMRVDDYLLKPSAQADEFSSTLRRLPLTMDSLDSRGLYLYDDGFRFILWFGGMLSPDIAMNLLGPDAAAELSKVTLGKHDTEMSRKLMGLIKKLRASDPSYYQPCNLVRQGEQPREGYLLLTNLVEDQTGGTNGYIDWIMQIHRQVMQNA